MKVSDIFGWIGWSFCEFSFRWFVVFDGPIPGDEDYRWYHHVSYFIGQKAYAVGCYFYGIEDYYENR